MHRTRSAWTGLSASLLIVGTIVVSSNACTQAERPEPRRTEKVELAEIDSVLAELGGKSTASLSRGTRWRLISSIGAGLPPSNFEAEDLPEPDTRGAALLEAYCDQCHGIPAPQMHAAEEWPLLLRRMEMRSRTLRAHMGGPHTSELVGEVLMSGMARTERPSEADEDSLLAYLKRNALPVAGPDEPAATPDGELFEQQCGVCHQLPAPGAHTAEEWGAVLARMQANMAMMDVPPMTDEEIQRLTRYLERRSDT